MPKKEMDAGENSGSSVIGRTLVGRKQGAEKDVEDGGHRHRQEHAEDAEQLAADQERQDHHHRVESDLLADDPGGNHRPLQALYDAEPGETDERMEEVLKLQ